MKVYGFEIVEKYVSEEGYLFKLIANEMGVVFLPHTREHRDSTMPGIRYADESKGNALAAMVKPGRIEFRFHHDFSDNRVKKIAQQMLQCPEFRFAANFTITYQARKII